MRINHAPDPKVSIIVPVYNTEQYLYQCLLSLDQQHLKDLEIIVVIDASPDKSYQLASDFASQASKLIHVLTLTDNVGLAEARNRGMQQAKGEYIGFVDSDDYVDLNMYQHLFTIAKQQQADWVSCGFTKFSSHGSECYAHQNISENTSVCNKLFRRQFVAQHQLSFPRGELFEDELFSYSAELLSHRGVYLTEPYYFYRHNPEGICRKAGADRQRLYARISSITHFMQSIEQQGLLPSAAQHCQEMLARHAFLQLRTQIKWHDLICYWRFTQHLIDKYQLNQSTTLSADNYFVRSFSMWQQREWALWLLRLRTGRADYATE